MNSQRSAPAPPDEVLNGVKIVYHPASHLVHVAVITLTPQERTIWRLIEPQTKRDFIDNLREFGGSVHFTGTCLQLTLPEGAFSGINPVENCSGHLKELEVMIDAQKS